MRPHMKNGFAGIDCRPRELQGVVVSFQAYGILVMLIFSHIAETMARAPPMMPADADPLEQCPEGLNTVCAGFAVDVRTDTVAHCLMLIGKVSCSSV